MGLVVAVGLLALPASASAATCSDYTNQADAQHAADTRDSDGDGVYCESLPCPCAQPGSSGGDGDGPVPRKRARTLKARITQVVDGDTVRVKATSGRVYTVRLIGSTPRRPSAPACPLNAVASRPPIGCCDWPLPAPRTPMTMA